MRCVLLQGGDGGAGLYLLKRKRPFPVLERLDGAILLSIALLRVDLAFSHPTLDISIIFFRNFFSFSNYDTY